MFSFGFEEYDTEDLFPPDAQTSLTDELFSMGIRGAAFFLAVADPVGREEEFLKASELWLARS